MTLNQTSVNLLRTLLMIMYRSLSRYLLFSQIESIGQCTLYCIFVEWKRTFAFFFSALPSCWLDSISLPCCFILQIYHSIQPNWWQHSYIFLCLNPKQPKRTSKPNSISRDTIKLFFWEEWGRWKCFRLVLGIFGCARVFVSGAATLREGWMEALLFWGKRFPLFF